MSEQDAKSRTEASEAPLPARSQPGARLSAGSGIPSRVVRKAQWVLLVMAGVILITIPFSPTIDAQQKVAIGASMLLFFIVGALSFRLTDDHPEWAFTALIGSGMVVCFSSMLIDPKSVRTVGVAFILATVALTIVHGVRGGIITAAAASVAVGIGSFLGGKAGYEWYEVMIFVILAFATAFVTDGMTRDRRRIANNLARLYEALRASSVSSPDLGTNLDAIVDSVQHTVGAVWCSVLLDSGGNLEIAAPTVAVNSSVAERVRADTRETGVGGPVMTALDTREIVVVDSVAGETRFPLWSEVWGPLFIERGMPSMVAVPLQTGTEVLGVLTVHGATERFFTEDDVALLNAYAEQIALVILRAQAYEKERESAQRLADADKLKSEFLAMVSHELRTPLTASKGFIDTVLLHWDRLDDERRQDLLRRASGNANELTRLISQLLDFARIDANRIELRPLACNLRELSDRVVADLAPVTAERTVAVDIDDRVKVMADPDGFNHILVNLITNANKFSPAGSTIHITAESNGDFATISVADEGMGIAADELEKVFERFYQSERTNLSRKGTGIGLAIVKRFVEHQGGHIWVESVLGEGATFRFTLPVADRVPPGVTATPSGVATPQPGATSTPDKPKDTEAPGDALVS